MVAIDEHFNLVGSSGQRGELCEEFSILSNNKNGSLKIGNKMKILCNEFITFCW